MRIFWKLLICMESVLLLTFTLYSCFIIFFSMNKSLEQERESCIEEAQFFEYALQSSIAALPKDYSVSELVVEQASEAIWNTIADEKNIMAIYKENGAAVFQKGENDSSLLEISMDNNQRVIRMIKRDDKYYVETLTALLIGDSTYFLEADRNITYVYEDRNQLLTICRFAMIFSILLSVIVSIIVAAGFTRPIAYLARETTYFAQGNYGRRVKVRGQDEISNLMRNYNYMANALVHNMEQLQDKVREQEDFTAAFAHELKTPLTSIIGYSDMLRSKELSKENQMMAADYIFKQGKRLEILSYKLMELMGMNQGKVQFEDVSMKVLAEHVVKLTAPLLKKKNILQDVDISDGIIEGDRDLLVSLLANLVDNSRKACDENGIIKIIGRNKNNFYQLKIEDNGCGIPDDEISKVTEAFYMVDKSRSRKEGGAGIGMALCEKIILLHGAVWEIKSEVGKGTTVTIGFNYRQQKSEASQNEEGEQE